ncbi:MAG: ComEC/Rec2 family competence protein [Treponema sp.]|jgi:competence protein ComEC|nr:ComEC/Rec2 family competence protein [Treponema sp.]
MIHKQSICCAALCWAVLAYTGLAPLPRRKAALSLLPLTAVPSAAPAASVERITGKVASNPAKTSSGQYYRFTLALTRVSGRRGTLRIDSGAKGPVTVLFPTELMEANFPGKLYSAAQSRARKTGGGVPDVPLEAGVILTVRGKILPPPEDRSGGFARLTSQSITFLAETAENAAYEETFYGRLEKFRGLCRLAFRRLMYAWGDAGGLFLALVSGASEYTNKDISGRFRAAGLAHVLAISGMHLALFSGIMRRASQKTGKQVSEILSVMAVLVFVWFAGFTPSLRRALIFFLLGLFAKRTGKRPGMTELLAATFCIHYFMAPEELFSLSFILSYTGLAGIFVLSGPAHRLLARIPCCYPANDIASSAGALLATSPVTAIFWGCVTPAGLLSTPAVTPLVSVFMIAGLLCAALSLLVPALLFPLGAVMNALYRCIAGLVRIFAQIPQIILR